MIWIVAIIVLLVILWATFQYIQFYKKEHLVCPKCGYKFKPPVLKMIVAPNYISGKYVKCPNCHTKEYCDVEKDL